MNVRQEIKYKGFDGNWKLLINWDNTLEVKFKNYPSRIYDMGRAKHITNIEHDTEYVTIIFQDKYFMQFKFEYDGFFVGDLYDGDAMFVDSIACFAFNHD